MASQLYHFASTNTLNHICEIQAQQNDVYIYKRVIPCRNMFKTCCFHICKLKANGTPNSEKKMARNGIT